MKPLICVRIINGNNVTTIVTQEQNWHRLGILRKTAALSTKVVDEWVEAGTTPYPWPFVEVKSLNDATEEFLLAVVQELSTTINAPVLDPNYQKLGKEYLLDYARRWAVLNQEAR